eukprot:TRINITY_DN2903_c0_g1_i5.p1 TRINITY_DN2903_c0_g1~~TRINITY_DN2903_c0_g1_i5.p1  ORF type:complete len:154 (+),score=19.06 TRINITY_DN2903_c0_g1_i5:129-590(+)
MCIRDRYQRRVRGPQIRSMVRVVAPRHQQAQQCPFAMGDQPRHIDWNTKRDPVSNLHCGGPSGVTPRGQGAFGRRQRPAPAEPLQSGEFQAGEGLNQFTNQTQRDVIWEQKRTAHLSKLGPAAGAARLRPQQSAMPDTYAQVLHPVLLEAVTD